MLTLLLLSLGHIPPPQPETKPADAPPTIVVTGVGRVIAAPDKVDVFVSVQTEEPNVEASMKENDSRLGAVMTATRNAGVAAADVQLSGVSMNTRDEYDKDGRVMRTRYLVRKELVICLRTPAKLDSLLVDISKSKALVSRIDFAAEALRTAEESLPVKAVENARARAEKMAAPVGATIGRALRIRTVQPATGNRGMETYSTGGGVSVGAAATGALTSQWHVEVEFELIAKK
jgi:uncharacterized protein YggE